MDAFNRLLINKKEELYSLLKKGVNKEISIFDFWENLYFLYGRGFNKKILSQKDKHSFDELNLIASRFSEFEEEHKLDPFAFSTEEDVYNQIVKCYNDLITSS